MKNNPVAEYQKDGRTIRIYKPDIPSSKKAAAEIRLVKALRKAVNKRVITK